MKLKIGLFGGVFDPIHYGHLFLAEYLRLILKLDRIIFIPSGDIGHKKQPTANKRDRLKMVCIATRNNNNFYVSSIDVRKKGLTYTIDTVKAVKSLFGREAQFKFLIGADNVRDIKNWKDWKTLTRLIKFVAISRPGDNIARGAICKIGSQWVKALKAPSLNISSTQIRKMIKEGNSAAQYMIPEKVWKYIQKKGLYQ